MECKRIRQNKPKSEKLLEEREIHVAKLTETNEKLKQTKELGNYTLKYFMRAFENKSTK